MRKILPVSERPLSYEVYLTTQKLDSLIAEACNAAGVTLVEQDMFRAGKRKTLRLYIDKPEGVSIDDCTNVSRQLSDALDLDPEIIEGAYTLEVSSPGLDRPLKSVADFMRNKGRLIRVTRSTGKPIVGTLVDADEQKLTLAQKGNGGEIIIARDEVLVAKVDVQI